MTRNDVSEPVPPHGAGKGRVLSIAGSDPSGGAGIEADIKTITALGGYAMSAISCLTVQNTQGVFGLFNVPPSHVGQQIACVLADIGVDAVKIGLLPSADMIAAVAAALDKELGSDAGGQAALVVDPVLVASSGDRLTGDDARDALLSTLFPVADLVTPNIPEAQVLTGMQISDVDDMKQAASMLLSHGTGAVLIKGGHLQGEMAIDLLMTLEGAELFSSPRLDTRNTHGTGCTLASAIACFLAQGVTLSKAVQDAHDYVQEAIISAPGFGRGGAGPLNHAVRIQNRD